jgi:hypothetical protein
MPSSVLLTIASSDYSTIAANRFAADLPDDFVSVMAHSNVGCPCDGAKASYLTPFLRPACWDTPQPPDVNDPVDTDQGRAAREISKLMAD